ncbi:MAG: AAC(3) family N-acetyltransferase [Pleurocapsa sp. SU_196_0]|nr:AAC(3) family N-acetyltransferase [Pleurocapsa sp. SU_196_0]
MLNFVRRAWAPPVSQSDLERTLWKLGVTGERVAIVHSSLSSFGNVVGGASAVVKALEHASSTLVMPAFTYYTLVWPSEHRSEDWPQFVGDDGPPFRADSPVSRDIGRVPQTLLERAGTQRSSHPALSFVALGANANEILRTQTLEHPYAPVGALYALDADVILLGVDMRSNTAMHYGEYLAGRPMLERWANTPSGAVRTYYPNCSAAFNPIERHLETFRSVELGKGNVAVMRVRDVVDTTRRLLERDPYALLCSYQNCRCQSVREKIKRQGMKPRRDTLLETYLGSRVEAVLGGRQ